MNSHARGHTPERKDASYRMRSSLCAGRHTSPSIEGADEI